MKINYLKLHSYISFIDDYVIIENTHIKQKRSTEGCSKFKSPETRQVQERLVSTTAKQLYQNNDEVTAVIPTDCPKSVRNRCVSEVFGGGFYVVKLLFGFFCECRGFCHRTQSDILLFLYMNNFTL